MRFSVIILLVLLSACSTQYVPPPTASSTSIINSDQTIQGTLDNGLKYVIHQQKNTKKVQFNLVVFTGGAYEEPNQKGAAHFVEHLAFRKTQRFSDRSIIKLIEQQGGKFGRELTGSTSAYYTDYRFELEDKKQQATAISILEQWSQHIVINQEIVNSEKPVILSEWRRRVGIENSWWQQTQTWFYKQWLNLTRKEGYVDQDVLGSPVQITNLSADILSKFYKKWYRPDNMAIVIVGNIDPDNIENQLKTVFANWQKPTQQLSRKLLDSVEEGITTSYSWDLNSSGIYLGFKRNGNSNISKIVLNKLYFYLLELRLLTAINNTHNTNIIGTYAVNDSVENQTSTTSLILKLNNTKQQPAFDLLQDVLTSMKNVNFSQQELDLSKKIVSQQLYSKAQLQVDNSDLSYQIMANLSKKIPWQSPKQLNLLAQEQLNKITLADFSNFATQFFNNKEIELHWFTPYESEHFGLSWWSAARQLENALSSEASSLKITLNSEINFRLNTVDEITEPAELLTWKLKNGGLLYLNQTLHADQKVELTRVKPYGFTQMSSVTSRIVKMFHENTQLINLAKNQQTDSITQKMAINNFVAIDGQQIKLTSRFLPRQFDTWLSYHKLSHQPIALASWRAEQIKQTHLSFLNNQNNRAKIAFYNFKNQQQYGSTPYNKLLTPQEITNFSADQLSQSLNQIFINSCHDNWFITGAISISQVEQQLIPLIEKSHSTCIEKLISTPTNSIISTRLEFNQGKYQKRQSFGLVNLTIDKNQLFIKQLIKKHFEIELRKQTREKGLTYSSGVLVTGSGSDITLKLIVQTDINKKLNMQSVVNQIIEQGISSQQLLTLKAQLTTDIRLMSDKNIGLHRQLLSSLKQQRRFIKPSEMQQWVNSLTIKQANSYFEQALGDSTLLQLDWLPE